MLSPESSGAAQTASSGALIAGSYNCWAAAGVAGTLQLVIKSASQYADQDGKNGDYTYDPQTRKIAFQSGPWTGYYGENMGPGKIGIASRPGGYYGTVCDLK
jgi:hypothetical protein